MSFTLCYTISFSFSPNSARTHTYFHTEWYLASEKQFFRVLSTSRLSLDTSTECFTSIVDTANWTSSFSTETSCWCPFIGQSAGIDQVSIDYYILSLVIVICAVYTIVCTLFIIYLFSMKIFKQYELKNRNRL